MTGMSVHSVSAKVVANLGWDKVRATCPVFAGDTLYAESKVLAKRESESRPTQGVVTVETRGFNQDAKQVMVFERTMLVYKRSRFAPGTSRLPAPCIRLMFRRNCKAPPYRMNFSASGSSTSSNAPRKNMPKINPSLQKSLVLIYPAP